MATTQSSPAQLTEELAQHMRRCGGGYAAWYVGVASDPRARLFRDHNVDEKRDAWIYRDCRSDSAARQVEAHFLRVGCGGAAGGGDRQSRYAYAYKVSGHSVE